MKKPRFFNNPAGHIRVIVWLLTPTGKNSVFYYTKLVKIKEGSTYEETFKIASLDCEIEARISHYAKLNTRYTLGPVFDYHKI